jgi:hypothetical protein
MIYRAYNSWGNMASLRQTCKELDQHRIPIATRRMDQEWVGSLG